MSQRFDALAAAAEVVLLVERIAKDSRHHGTRATVGLLNVWPGSITTIPGRVDLTVDVRDVDADRQRETAVEIVQSATLACERRGVAIVPEVMADASPVILPAWLRRELIAAAAEFDVDCRSLPSGASHDAQMINTVIPTGMLFVPSRNGISHAPDESTSADQIATGARVLGGAMLRLDALPAPTGPTAVSAA
jgi:hydantoinase/carbamoylase family amidase